MPAVLIGLSFLFGLVIGSFLNVAVMRGSAGQSLGGRSRCDSCQRTLSVFELIPVISFTVQKAQCRSCGAVLSWQYPLVELGTGLCYAFAAWSIVPDFFSGSFSFVILGMAFLALGAVIVILVADVRFQIIPDGAVLALLAVGTGASVLRGNFLRDGEAAAALSLFFAALWFFSRGRWMGLGDAKLTLATSFLAGFPASIAGFLFSFWLGGIAAVPLVVLGKKSMRSRIPFGPFILAGAGAAYFFSGYFFRATGLFWLW